MLISADAKQLEWRTAVELSHDEIGLKEILNHEDTHSLNEKAFTLPSRLIAKKYLFRTIFRGTGYSFSIDPEFIHVSSSAKFWDKVNEKFYGKYQGLDKTHHEWAALVMAGKPIVNPMGMAWTINIPRDKYGNLKVPWTILSNYPVQGTGALIMKLARVIFYKRIKKAGIPCLFLTTVHDSIVVDAESKYIQVIAEIFHESFAAIIQNIENIFGYKWIVPLECEVKIGMNMKDMVPY